MIEQCKSCKNKETINGIIGCVYMDADCRKGEMFSPITNADRIRAMSDEELEKAVGHRSLCYYIQDETNFCNEREVCGDCIREWLKQPADMRGEEE